jgi:predicted nucleic acid-binding protein
VICLDTNYLILGLSEGTREAGEMIAWAQAGEVLITPTIAWFEFRCGPVTPVQVATTRAFVQRIVPFDEPQAVEAARLFNATGRKRTLRVDALVASAAIVAGARLATNNRKHFGIFARHGLRLV